MSHQSMEFDEINRDTPAISSEGYHGTLHYEEMNRDRPSPTYYEGTPHQSDPFIGATGQKLAEQAPSRMIALDQRLILAIVSLVLLMIMGLVGAILTLATSGGSDVTVVPGYGFRPDFGPGDEGPFFLQAPHVYHIATAPSNIFPLFMLVFIVFTIAVIVINALFARSVTRK